MEAAALGPMAILVLSQPTLAAALEVISTHVSSLQGGTSNRLTVVDDLAAIEYRVEDPALWPRRQDAEFSLVAMLGLLRTLCGPRFAPVEVHLEHARPHHGSKLDRLTGCPCYYGETSNRIIIETAELNRPFAVSPLTQLSAQGLGQFLERHLRDLRMEGDQSPIKTRVAEAIQDHFGRASPTIRNVARQLNLPARTLQRALAEAGTSFSALLAEQRRATAERLLATGELGLEQIGMELGYSDATAFSRAYRGWTGTTPRAQAKRHRL